MPGGNNDLISAGGNLSLAGVNAINLKLLGPSLAPGAYTVSVMRNGFQTSTYNNVELGQGQQVRLNFTLQVSAGGQSVEVIAEADTLLATTSASSRATKGQIPAAWGR